MTTPEISVIMSVYNGEEYISEAVESVLNQTFKDIELIIINDCSKDNTLEILEGYARIDERVRVITNEVNLRLPSSLNKAMSLARGKYIARMDADDICLPERLERQYKFMQENDEIALSSCRFMTIKNGVVSSGGCGGKCDFDSVKALLLVTNPILHPGIIARADVIKSLSYDKSFTCTEDMELWTRFILEGHKIEIQPEYLMIYRLHDKQITATTLEKQHSEVVELQKRYFSSLIAPMQGELEDIYIKGIYFRENRDVNDFCRLLKWMKRENRRAKRVKCASLNYAMLEILAEYKRKGISKKDLLRAMLCIGLPFLIREIPSRKKRARRDGLKCIEAANKIGLRHSGGPLEFPTFSK